MSRLVTTAILVAMISLGAMSRPPADLWFTTKKLTARQCRQSVFVMRCKRVDSR
jgi:hypothetical protein